MPHSGFKINDEWMSFPLPYPIILFFFSEGIKESNGQMNFVMQRESQGNRYKNVEIGCH